MKLIHWIKLEPWVRGKSKNMDTYPPEGIPVLVSDGVNYDVAWYLYSQSYVWMKDIVKNDDCLEFVDFIPTHWTSIPEINDETHE